MSNLISFLERIKATAKCRAEAVVVASMGRDRIFRAYDKNSDTFIFENDIEHNLDSRPSVLIVRKSALRKGAAGWVMTVATGNHSVSAFPLLDGRFWKLSLLPPEKRSMVLMNDIVCANIVNRKFELSQRDVPTEEIIAADRWLLANAKLPLDAIVMVERNVQTLEHYRSLGQDWRVKPLAWTEKEIRVALAGSRRSISSKLVYYHSVRGIHFLSYSDFKKLCVLAKEDFDSFFRALKELVGVFESGRVSFMRLHRHRAHHEIELFGLARGVAHESIVPQLELLAEDIVLGKISREKAACRMQKIETLYAKLLTRPELADSESKEFVETMYMYITGEVYSVSGEGSTPAFDDRRTALPGAAFKGGKIIFHPNADSRTVMLMTNLKSLLSKDEVVQYANVYELRGEGDDVSIGKGSTREIAFKTNRRPLERALIEKALSHAGKGYAGYMLSRVEGFRALGVSIGTYRVLRRPANQEGRHFFDFYIRNRCEGEPLESIPAHFFRKIEDSSLEDADVVRDIALLMGDAAAQNMAMKKFDAQTKSPLFGVGKEIYAFGYDIKRRRSVPKSVSICSIRGTLGWKNISLTESNFTKILEYYLEYYATALVNFSAEHTLDVEELVSHFLDGFAARTEALDWKASILRDRFHAFKPDLPEVYNFDNKWRFAMWAVKKQRRELQRISNIFRMFVKRKVKS